MFDRKELRTTAELKTDGEAGAIEAVISTFDVEDRDGDIVLASAFTVGQEIPMVWSHNWDQPIGKGTIAIDGNRAIFKGQLWLDTIDGEQAYRKIKNAGPLQEYSWGFLVLDSDYVERDGKSVRVIKRTEVFEASPVLVGAAGRQRTGTLALKSIEGLNDPHLRLPLEEHSAEVLQANTLVLAANVKLAARLKSHADLKTQPTATQKDGRVLSEANRERIKQHADSVRQVADDLDALHAATAPTKSLDLSILADIEVTIARLNGVQ